MRSVSDELTNCATSALPPPHLFVDLYEAGAWNQALGDLIRQRLGLQEGMMRKNPDVTELVGDRRFELLLRQLTDEILFDRQPEASVEIVKLHREHQRIPRND